MRILSLVYSRRPVRGGPHGRVAEPHGSADFDKPSLDRNRGVVAGELEHGGRAPKEDRIARGLCRGDGQELPAGGLEVCQTAPEALLDLTRYRQGGRQTEATREFGRGQPSRQ